MGTFYIPHEELDTALTDLMLTLLRLPNELNDIREQIVRNPQSKLTKQQINKGLSCLKKLISDADNATKKLIQKLSDANIPIADVKSDKQPDRFQTKSIRLLVDAYRKQEKIYLNCIVVKKALSNSSN